MTQWNDAPLDEIRSLVDERARYEGWLAALDARRDQVPAHVLDRVREDYRARVERVVSALSAHAGVLRDGVGALETRDNELRRTIGEREDALAEVELRALVGEFDEPEASRRREEVNGALGALRAEAERGGSKLSELRALLDRAAPPAPAARASTPPPAPAGAATGAASSPTPVLSGPVSGPDDSLAGLEIVPGPSATGGIQRGEDAGAVMDAAFGATDTRAGTAPGVPGSVPTMDGRPRVRRHAGLRAGDRGPRFRPHRHAGRADERRGRGGAAGEDAALPRLRRDELRDRVVLRALRRRARRALTGRSAHAALTHVGPAPSARSRPPRASTRTAGAQAVAASFLASCDLCRAALFLWISPLRAARSSRLTADTATSGVAPSARAFLSAVRRADRCARLRTAAARDFRMFFLAEAMFGTKGLSTFGSKERDRRSSGARSVASYPVPSRHVKARQPLGTPRPVAAPHRGG
jgi:hypothetical protein